MADLSEGSKYRDVVESYMQNRLPQEGTHPSFQYLGDKRNSDLGPPPPAYSQADPELPLLLLPTEDQSTTVQDRDLNLVMYDSRDDDQPRKSANQR